MNRYLDADKTVIDFGASRPKRALERLNRLSGLEFAHLPTSLVNQPKRLQACRTQMA